MSIEFKHTLEQLEKWRTLARIPEDAVPSLTQSRKLLKEALELASRRPRILVVDDEKDILDLFQTLLDSRGYEGIFCVDPRVAVERCQKERVDVIVCDLMMPDLDGYSFIRAIRRIPGTRKAPILVYSSTDARQAIPQLRQSKIDGYIQKPGDPKVILDKIAALVNAVWADG